MTPAHLQALVEAGRQEGLFPAAAWAVIHSEAGEVASGAVGTVQGAPPGPDTVWDLASLTKPISTATGLLILAQEGVLHFGDEVNRFLPEPSPSLEGITLRHCLTHTSGLKAWEKLHSQDLTRTQVVERVVKAERCRAPGTGYAYSDLGYILLGEALSAAAGMTQDAFAAERISGPLGMESTCYLPPEAWRPRIAETRCPDRGRVLVGEVHDGNCHALEGVAGHAGLFGSLSDLIRYARMLLRHGELEGTRVLSPLAVEAMGRNCNPTGISGHTIGWFTSPSGYLPAGDLLPADTFGHTGFTGTSLLVSPSAGAAFLLLTNRVMVERDSGEFLRFRRRFHNAAAGLLP